jgi:hypothetical protein
LLALTTLRLAQGALTDSILIGIAATSFALFSSTKIDSLWVVLASALIGFLSAMISAC